MTTDEKEKFTMSLLNNSFNITKTCRENKIDPNVYYYLIQNDEEFRNMFKSNYILQEVTKTSMFEVLTSGDIPTKIKGLEILTKAGLLPKLLDMELDTATKLELNLISDNSRIKFV